MKRCGFKNGWLVCSREEGHEGAHYDGVLASISPNERDGVWVCTCGRRWYSSEKHVRCPHCGRPCHYPGDAESTPPETPYAKAKRRPESLVPPRARPRVAVSASLIALASSVATEDRVPLWARITLVAGLSFVAWAVGYFTEPPRRKFRRDD